MSLAWLQRASRGCKVIVYAGLRERPDPESPYLLPLQSCSHLARQTRQMAQIHPMQWSSHAECGENVQIYRSASSSCSVDLFSSTRTMTTNFCLWHFVNCGGPSDLLDLFNVSQPSAPRHPQHAGVHLHLREINTSRLCSVMYPMPMVTKLS